MYRLKANILNYMQPRTDQYHQWKENIVNSWIRTQKDSSHYCICRRELIVASWNINCIINCHISTNDKMVEVLTLIHAYTLYHVRQTTNFPRFMICRNVTRPVCGMTVTATYLIASVGSKNGFYNFFVCCWKHLVNLVNILNGSVNRCK